MEEIRMEDGARYLDSSAETKEERVIDVRSLRGGMKAFNARLGTMKAEARNDFKTVCDRCIRMDYGKGEMKEPDQYVKELKKAKEHVTNDPKTGKKLGIMVDYVCPRGHGVSFEITGEEYKRYKEFNGVNEIVERTGADKTRALKEYRLVKGNVEEAIEKIGEKKSRTPEPDTKPEQPKNILEEVKDDKDKGKG
jgi:hypothetical protein